MEFQAYIDEYYKQFNEIYTGGSKINEPVPSVASAIYIPYINRMISWKIRCEHSIISAEFFAILQALKYVKSQLGGSNWIIFSDSMSVLQIIVVRHATYCSIVNEIQDLVNELILRYNILLHWVKSHKGIVGNEIADKSANMGHQNNSTVLCSLQEKNASVISRKSS